MDVCEKLVQGARILAADGQGDLIWGHVTARVPGRTDRLYMKPAQMGLGEIEVDDLIQIDMDGRKVEGERAVHSEVFIHTEIMRMRGDVSCVVHTHAPHAVAFGALGRELVPVGHEGSLFVGGLPVFGAFTDLVVTPDRGRQVAAILGGHSAVLLRNHGLVTCGATVEQAVMTAVFLEKACRVQLLALCAGGPAFVTPPEEARVKRERIYTEAAVESAFAHLARQLNRGRVAGGQQPLGMKKP